MQVYYKNVLPRLFLDGWNKCRILQSLRRVRGAEIESFPNLIGAPEPSSDLGTWNGMGSKEACSKLNIAAGSNMILNWRYFEPDPVVDFETYGAESGHTNVGAEHFDMPGTGLRFLDIVERIWVGTRHKSDPWPCA